MDNIVRQSGEPHIKESTMSEGPGNRSFFCAQNRLQKQDITGYQPTEIEALRQHVDIPLSMVGEAKAELIDSTPNGIGKFTPKTTDFLERYPKTAKLAQTLAEIVFEPTWMDLSFIRATKKQPHIFIDNLHFDSRYVGYSKCRDIRGTFWRPSEKVELWRNIFNLNDEPRHLQVINQPLEEIRRCRIDLYGIRPVGRKILNYAAPEEIPQVQLAGGALAEYSETVVIPPFDGKTLHGIGFWSSKVLHAGITSRAGQMIAIAAKWTIPPETESEGYYA